MIKNLSRQIRRIVHGTKLPTPPQLPHAAVLDYHAHGLPTAANIAAIFKDQWVSKLPPEMGLDAGRVPLFEDPRIQNLLASVDVVGKDVLELGPLEAGHTTQLVRAGAGSVTAIESNSLAFLRCLAIKEALGLSTARFLLGDFVEYLRERKNSFDTCVACGVLYHMQNPVELLELLSHACRSHLFLWTHYYDPRVHAENPDAGRHLTDPQPCSWKGFRHTLVRYEYLSALDTQSFCGGTAPFAHWLPRPDLLAALEFFGFREIRVMSEDVNHPNGPSLSLLASR